MSAPRGFPTAYVTIPSMHSSDDSFSMNAAHRLDSRIGALMREIDACIDERRHPPVSRAREVLAANHANARMRRGGRARSPGNSLSRNGADPQHGA